MAVFGMLAPQDLGESSGDYLTGFSNPLAIDALSPIGWTSISVALDIVSGLPVLGVGLAALVNLVTRWRRSQGTERLQMRAFALGALAMVFLLVLGAGTAIFGVGNPLVENLATTLAISAPPAAVGVAVLRYRLYEIDRLISRTVTYGLVVAALALVYMTIAIGLPQLLGLDAESSPLVVAAATLSSAALFNPLRRGVQSWVDRRFNRARYDARLEVDQLAQHLRSSGELDQLVDEVVGVVSRTMEPETTAIWIRQD